MNNKALINTKISCFNKEKAWYLVEFTNMILQNHFSFGCGNLALMNQNHSCRQNIILWVSNKIIIHNKDRKKLVECKHHFMSIITFYPYIIHFMFITVVYLQYNWLNLRNTFLYLRFDLKAMHQLNLWVTINYWLYKVIG